jgi:hypothetical protein
LHVDTAFVTLQTEQAAAELRGLHSYSQKQTNQRIGGAARAVHQVSQNGSGAVNNPATCFCHVASRQEERQEAEEARSRLQAEAAARRKQRKQQLLLQQQEDIAAAQAR